MKKKIRYIQRFRRKFGLFRMHRAQRYTEYVLHKVIIFFGLTLGGIIMLITCIIVSPIVTVEWLGKQKKKILG